MDEHCALDATELERRLRSGEISAREVTAAHLGQIERYNPALNAVVTVTVEQAMAAAAAADEAFVASGPIGPLHGLPVAHKDLQDTAGIRTTYGSPIYADNVPEKSSELVESMARAGAICLGKTNTPEFGIGSHTYNEVFGVTRNPWATGMSAGGSSGGAAAALAARMVALADGSDMGGSLRNPAGFCNVVGFRPSMLARRPEPLRGDSALALDGPMARSVEDVALLLGVLSGRDIPRLDTAVANRRVAWCKTIGGVPVAREVLDALEPAVLALFSSLDIDLVELTPDLSGAEDAFRTIRAAELAAGLGAAYAHRRDQLNADVAWNIEVGLALSADEVANARLALRTLQERMGTFMRQIDALALPVSQVVPFPVEQHWVHEIGGQPMENYLDWMASCYLISATGLPAISVPCTFTPSGLPVGLQLVGKPSGDIELLSLAKVVELETGASRRIPPLLA
ncbi:MAG: amidase family protein [Acidimicrobiales bacterium]